FGFGPLEELFPDPTVKEILVLGPDAVVVRREHGWTPTNVKFRDAEHIQEVLDRAGLLGETVSPGLHTSALDVRLSTGFRVVAAYIDEYCQTEKVLLSGTDQGRLMLEILTGMKR